MKITESQLKQIIDEEIMSMFENGEIDEGVLDRLKARGAGAISKLKTGAKGIVQKGAASAMGAAAKLGAGDAATKAATSLNKAAADTKAAGADQADRQAEKLSPARGFQRRPGRDVEKVPGGVPQAHVRRAPAGQEQKGRQEGH